jgi:HK97 gp10 family phage protein
MDVKGLAQFEAQLRQLETKEAKKIIRKSLRAAAKPVQKQAQANAPKQKGNLAKSIKVRAGKVKRKGQLRVIVTTSGGDNLFTGDEFYGAFQELGWKKVPAFLVGGRFYSTPRGTEPTTEIPGKHFMQHAAEQMKSAAVAAFSATMKPLLDKALATK